MTTNWLTCFTNREKISRTNSKLSRNVGTIPSTESVSKLRTDNSRKLHKNVCT